MRRSWLAARGLAPTAAAAAALHALRWRGADDAQFAELGDFVLGCARLAISELRSRQPVRRRGATGIAVLNGALTGARAEFARLFGKGRMRTRLPNDAWLPLALVEHGAFDRLAELRGHHALAVVTDADGRLVLARDALGEKPLFVAHAHGQVVAFASTLPALEALGVPAELPAAAVGEFFTRGTCSAIQARDPAVRIDADLAGVLADPPVLGPTNAVARRAPADLERALVEATARCLDVRGPVALSLSGGLDSSCLAVTSARLGHRLAAYQFCATDSDGEERHRAAAVAEQCGHRLRPVDGGPTILDALPDLTRDWGLPLGDPSVLAMHAVARAAAGDGHRVLLAGEGADELLLGYDRHRAMRWLRRCLCMPTCLTPPWSMRRSARLVRAALGRDPYAELLAVTPPAFRRTVLAATAAHAPALPRAPQLGDPLQRARWLDQHVYLRRDLLPKLDVATMAAAIEGRCPYLDPEFRAAALAIDPRAALGKRPLRHAFRAALPTAVLDGRKRGLGLPLDRWLRGTVSLLDLLREPRTRQRPHLRPGGLDRAIDRHRSGRADLGHALYLVAAYECHLRSREGG